MFAFIFRFKRLWRRKRTGAELGPYSLSIPRCEALFSHIRDKYPTSYFVNDAEQLRQLILVFSRQTESQ